MQPSSVVSIVGAGSLLALLGCAPARVPSASAATADGRCAVWDREISFASSVAAHDTAAFREHVHPHAMFVDGEKSTLRGREAIAAAWRPLLVGEPVRLVWHPTSVVASADPDIAVSRGPYIQIDLRPAATARYQKGIFQSVWVRDADHVWRVLVDGGTPDPVPVTKEEADAVLHDAKKPCNEAEPHRDEREVGASQRIHQRPRSR